MKTNLEQTLPEWLVETAEDYKARFETVEVSNDMKYTQLPLFEMPIEQPKTINHSSVVNK